MTEKYFESWCHLCHKYKGYFENNTSIEVNAHSKGKVQIKGMYGVPICNNPLCEWSKAKERGEK